MSWLAVWTRAVIGPASRRVTGVWIGTGIVGGIVFGPTGMHARDFTQLALHVPMLGGIVGLMWLLLFLPTARVLVRADGASFLRSLPGPRWQPLAVGTAAMIVLQAPWLALWVLGDGARGLAVVLALTGVIGTIAMWRPRPPRARWPHWRRDRAALRGVYLRALRRRAGDAIVRGVGMAVLAGLTAGLVARNNHLSGIGAAVLANGVIAVVLVPGWVGVMFPLVEAHRATAWLAASLGITEGARVAVLAMIVSGVYLAGTAIAALASLAFGAFGWLWLTGPATAIGMALIVTRALVWADRTEPDAPKDIVQRGAATSRIVIGGVVATAIAVVCLAWLGGMGASAIVVIGIATVLA